MTVSKRARYSSFLHSCTFALSGGPKSRIPLILVISYASASGTLSGMCLLFAKSGVELLLLTVGGENQVWRWQAWLFIIGLCAFALLQMWYLHKALISPARYHKTSVSPFYRFCYLSTGSRTPRHGNL